MCKICLLGEEGGGSDAPVVAHDHYLDRCTIELADVCLRLVLILFAHKACIVLVFHSGFFMEFCFVFAF